MDQNFGSSFGTMNASDLIPQVRTSLRLSVPMPPAITTDSTPATTVADDMDWLEDVKCAVRQTAGPEIVVDISTVARITSAELNELIRLHLDAKQDGRKLVLRHAQPQLWQIFTLTRLNRLIEIRDPVTEVS
jgi:anti-anti-sigma regulatory factor